MTIRLDQPHPMQAQILDSRAKRRVVRAGRRGGKTHGIAIHAVEQFMAGKRVLYAAPTSDQLATFWRHVATALQEPVAAGYFVKNETDHTITAADKIQRIKAKTAWNPDTLRGDYADVLILDEFQMMDERTWDEVGAPMLLDNDGDAVFIYTPLSLRTVGRSHARDPQHAAKLFSRAQADKSGRWAAFSFSSGANPHISAAALAEIAGDMTALAYRQEILAEDVDEAPGALWTRAGIEARRVDNAPAQLDEVVIGVDPSATATGDEAGIVAAGRVGDRLYVLEDDSVQASPAAWAQRAINAYYRHRANYIVAEANNGGEMVQQVLAQVDSRVPVRLVYASRGKATRAEPVAAIYEQGRGHHVGGGYMRLEDELCLWTPGDPSPNRLDALVWAATALLLRGAARAERGALDGLASYTGISR